MNQNKKRIYRSFLCFILCCSICSLILICYIGYWQRVPAIIKVRANVDEKIDLQIPVTGELYREDAMESVAMNQVPISLDLSRQIVVRAHALDQYKVKLRLFGIIPYKTIAVEVIKDRKLIPAGLPIGIYVKTVGPLVLGTSSFQDERGNSYAPANYILQPGDYLISCNGIPIEGKKQFLNLVKESKGEAMTLELLRKDERLQVVVTPKKDMEGEYKLGLWIRDNAQGIGTLTYVDEDNYFGALGHGINDMDLSVLMHLSHGEIYHTDIVGITKGEKGSPGELTGYIQYEDASQEGDIYCNSNRGIFGICNESVKEKLIAEALPIALKQEIVTGQAQIISSATGEPVYYDVEIEEINLVNDNVNRGIVLHVTDKRLLNLTGGIVQGMSGAPIIQKGKIVGAVTHVLINDPERGYGIFIEEMLEE